MDSWSKDDELLLQHSPVPEMYCLLDQVEQERNNLWIVGSGVSDPLSWAVVGVSSEHWCLQAPLSRKMEMMGARALRRGVGKAGLQSSSVD